MKIKTIALTLLTSLCLGLTAVSVSAHGDDAEKTAGPNGGRVLTGTDPRAEFFVTGERKVQITFLDDHGQAVAPAGQKVLVIAGQRSAPVQLTFAPEGDVLLSNVALPAGNRVPTIVQITPADGKTATERFNVNLATCPECHYAEYACICDH